MTSGNIPHSEEDRKTLKKKVQKSQWAKGGKDPALLKDIFQIESDFRAADAETAKRLDE